MQVAPTMSKSAWGKDSQPVVFRQVPEAFFYSNDKLANSNANWAASWLTYRPKSLEVYNVDEC